MSSRTIELGACVSRWLGRGLALLLFLFWGAFFVEHLAEWFSHPQAAPPPPRAWVAQGLHLVMLIGLALMLQRDRLGAVVTALGTAVSRRHRLPRLPIHRPDQPPADRLLRRRLVPAPADGTTGGTGPRWLDGMTVATPEAACGPPDSREARHSPGTSRYRTRRA